MKTLYKQFIVATVIILICSIGIGFALANVMYFTFTKDKTDAQNVETAQHIVNILEQTHRSEQAMDAYLASVGELGYQIVIVTEEHTQLEYGEPFSKKSLPDDVVDNVLNGIVYHGMQTFHRPISHDGSLFE